MKYFFLLLLSSIIILGVNAQSEPGDTLPKGMVTINKDPRIDILGKKMAEYNAKNAYLNGRTAKGYRLMLLSSNDRNMAMKLRSQLLQLYPDQGVYMSFQSPYIKLKFGNFLEKDDAERMRKEIMNRNLVPGNIYIVPETIEVKPDKNAVPDEE